MSNGPSAKSLSLIAVQRLRSTSGAKLRKRWSLGISHSDDSEGDAATASLRRWPRRLSDINAVSNLSNPSDNSSSALAVAGLSASLPFLRSNSGVSKNPSSERI
jgi:hypothetical protein